MALWTVVNVQGGFSNAWDSDGVIAIRAHNGPSVLKTECATVDEALKRHVGTVWHPHTFEEALLQPGEYHPRMHRAAYPDRDQELPSPEALHGWEMAASLQSARNLFAQFREVYRYVEPSPSNDGAYGDQLRSLLILACTEVESALRAVLLANNGAAAGDRLSTRDYVKLAGPMRLTDWQVRMSGFPDYPPVGPFAGWDAAAPTQSLAWYDAYNASKHDRERNLSKATLKHTIAAMCGVYVMLAAQFGIEPLSKPNPVTTDFAIAYVPDWRLAEYYVPALVDSGNGPWKSKAYF